MKTVIIELRSTSTAAINARIKPVPVSIEPKRESPILQEIIWAPGAIPFSKGSCVVMLQSKNIKCNAYGKITKRLSSHILWGKQEEQLNTFGWNAVAIPATWVPWGEQSVTRLKMFPSSYTFVTKEHASNLLNIPYFRSILRRQFHGIKYTNRMI